MSPPVRSTDASGAFYYSGVDANEATETKGPPSTTGSGDVQPADTPKVTADAGEGASTLPQAPIGDPIAASAMKANMGAVSVVRYSASSDSNIGFAKTPPQGGPPPNAGGKATGGSDTDARNFDAAKAERERIDKYRMPTSRLPTDGQAVSADAALDMLEKDPDLIAHSMSKEFHRDIWHNSLGMKGEPPVAYRVGNGVRIDYERLTPAQKQHYKSIVEAQEKTKWARTSKWAGAAEKGEANAARQTKQGMGVDNKPMGDKGPPGGAKAAEKAAEKEGAVATEKGMGAAGKGAGAAGKVAQGGEEVAAGAKGAGAAGKVAQGGGEVAEAAVKGAGKAAVGEVADVAAKGIGTGAGIASRGAAALGALGLIGDVLLTAGLPLIDFLTATADVKQKIIQQNTERGFAVGMAAALVGASPEYLKNVHDIQPGTREGHEAYDKALQAGYDYVQSLPPQKRKELHDAAFKQLAAEGRTWNPHQDDPNKSKAANRQTANEDLGELVWMVGGTLGPAVKQIFENAVEQRRNQAEQEQKAYAPHGEHGFKV